MTRKKKRIYFYLSENEFKELENHLKKWSSKYSDRTEFINKAISNLISIDENKNTNLNSIHDEVKKIKSLLELNSQFVYSIMEDKNIRSSNLYYGNTLNAIKSKEAIDDFYRDKLMNENKIKSENKNINKENVEKSKEENKSRWRVTDL